MTNKLNKALICVTVWRTQLSLIDVRKNTVFFLIIFPKVVGKGLKCTRKGLKSMPDSTRHPLVPPFALW